MDCICVGVALATTLHVSHETLVTCWEAFSLTHKVSELTNGSFDAYRAQVYKHAESTAFVTSRDGTIHSRNTKRQCSTNVVTPPVAKKHQGFKQSSTPLDSVVNQKNNNSSMRSFDTAKSPPLVKYNNREKAGEVVVSFNPKGWPAISPSEASNKVRCVVTSNEFETNIAEPYRHMFTVIGDRAQALEDQLVCLGEQIIQRYGICAGDNGSASIEQVNAPSQEAICCVGRICNEAS